MRLGHVALWVWIGLVVGAMTSLGVPASPALAQARAAGPFKEITLTTPDGVSLYGVYRQGRKPSAPAVVLLHMLGRTQDDWRYFADNLQRNGYHVLSLDLRGHGKSLVQGSKTLDFQTMAPEDFLKMTEDVAAAVTWLRSQPDVSPERVALIGANIGGNAALRYAVGDPKISHVAMLSPGLDYKGLSIEGSVQQYGDRPLFMAVSREDNYSAKSVLVLDATSTSTHKEIRIFTGAGHGTKMLSREPGLEATLLAWLNGTLAPVDSSGLPNSPPIAPPPVRPPPTP